MKAKTFNPIASLHRYEAVGFNRKQAETLATELHDAMDHLVTHEQLIAAENRIVIKLGVMLTAVATLGVSIILAVLA